MYRTGHSQIGSGEFNPRVKFVIIICKSILLLSEQCLNDTRPWLAFVEAHTDESLKTKILHTLHEKILLRRGLSHPPDALSSRMVEVVNVNGVDHSGCFKM